MLLRDKFWLWGHPEGRYNSEYGNDKISRMTPNTRRIVGCYLYNFGENKQASGEAVKWQLDWYREKLLSGEIEGVSSILIQWQTLTTKLMM